jgi:hypothetical protein
VTVSAVASAAMVVRILVLNIWCVLMGGFGLNDHRPPAKPA